MGIETDENTESNSQSLHSFQDYVDQMIQRLLERAETEVPEYGDFAPVREMFRNPSMKISEWVSSYGICILKLARDVEPNPKMRYVEACAYDGSGEYKASKFVASGTKSEVLEKLRDQAFLKELNYHYGDLYQSLRY